jgi:hypothetical protein
MKRYHDVGIGELAGKFVTQVCVNDNLGYESVDFHVTTPLGKDVIYHMYHPQDCCENVTIEEVHGGGFSDLVSEVIVEAREDTRDDADYRGGEAMWTFYTLRTNDTTLTIRWYGQSNGYYGIGVQVDRFEKEV